MKYIIIDTANMFQRARHVAFKNSDTLVKASMAIHITLNSVNKVAHKFGADHIVFALEGRSWRKDFYKPYKANREESKKTATPNKLEEEALFWKTYEEFVTFLAERTNVSVIRSPRGEGDDVISRFIHLHPDDEHYIISGDGDFDQLVTSNVSRYNGIENQLITINGIVDDNGKPVLDKKTKEPLKLEDSRYLVFEHAMRGDSTDYVFSAYPGIRKKGSSKRYGLLETFSDIDKQGFVWNNVMLHRWVDPDGVEHCVRDDYQRNLVLIDLNAQPQDIKDEIDRDIRASINTTHVPSVGAYFLKFCGKYDLENISKHAEKYTWWLNKSYTGVLKG